ncbi:LOW QUALITY PROTEIN: Hypothetical protein PHPALM_19662 [Phytophthora palmivora]|uniref:PiggyBac transposable element-derived protein domain-containing protein n=1 Tax=Phytophthora palmivora TaxID=4796 RepID=A0A2P4XGX3_9STRA|nr:LOW QUALITY PROTEIN: Hypothetical protein PHPALM_19662 [Phytophthora palmivora]
MEFCHLEPLAGSCHGIDFAKLHGFFITDNTAPVVSKVRAWKIRSVLEKTFKEGYVLGSRVAIANGMLPSHSSRNLTRTYMKATSHKWGSKCAMTCCAETGYCKRFVSSLVLFCYADTIVNNFVLQESSSMLEERMIDPFCNPKHCLCLQGITVRNRLIIAVRYYISFPLAQQLRVMGFKLVGGNSNEPNRVEWPKNKRAAPVPSGTFGMAVAATDPGLIVLGWADNNVVYFLASYLSAAITAVQRRERNLNK